MNSQNVAYGLGQLGSVYISGANQRFIPPSGMVITSILVIVNNTQFTHMIPENSPNAKHVGSTVVANGTGDGGTIYDASEALGGNATGDLNNIADVSLPAGATIHGRWSQVMIKASSTGGAILYFGY